jgi:carboxyl-terminal processing protease
MKKFLPLAILPLFLILASCGGGGGSSGTCTGSSSVCFPTSSSNPPPSTTTTPPPSTTGTVPPNTPPSAQIGKPADFANICTPSSEKSWARAHLDDVYLWYNEIVNVPPENYSTPTSYFDALLVRSRDRFSFTSPKGEIDSFFQAGEDVGYGMRLVNSFGNLRVAYVQPNSPGSEQNVQRGAQIIGINGASITTLSADTQIAALYPTRSGATNRFDILDVGSAGPRSVSLTARNVVGTPVLSNQIITTPDNKKIGYIVFTDHIATAEDPLIVAMRRFLAIGIDELVIDVRYNGGGFLYIANNLASMIGGARVQNRVFERLLFNDKNLEQNNDPSNRLLFTTTGRFGQFLPQLNLPRVFLLTTSRTCSASESIINGLSPFMQVITIGGTTCGKPYGFRQTDNCTTAYFASRFSGVNDLGQGGYTNGFAPTCSVPDDLDHPLGDTTERQLASALYYAKNGACSVSSFAKAQGLREEIRLPELDAKRQLWRENRIIK